MMRLTQHAPDKWESARFTSLFHTSGLYWSQAHARPPASNASHWALNKVEWESLEIRTKLIKLDEISRHKH